MNQRFLLPMLGLAASLCLLFAGCGGGKGAEDTGEDGHVGGDSTSEMTTTTTATTTNHSTANSTDGDTANTTVQDNQRSGNGMGGMYDGNEIF